MSKDITPFSHDSSFRDIVHSFFNNKIWPTFDDGLSSFSRMMPRVDISETDQEIQVVADIPGYSADSIDIDVQNGILTISGNSEEQSEDKHKKYYRYERSSGSFSRSFTLPTEVDEDNVTAICKNGTITITLPKVHTKNKKKIVIKNED